MCGGGVVAVATHHHTGRPGAAVVILSDEVFFVLVKQTDCRRRWRETLSGVAGAGDGGGRQNELFFKESIDFFFLIFRKIKKARKIAQQSLH